MGPAGNAAIALVDAWSAKDPEVVVALLRDDVRVAGPLAPGGLITGITGVRRYLAAQNGSLGGLPPEQHEQHRAMAASTARIRRIVATEQSAAVEATLGRSDGSQSMDVAIFVDVESSTNRITDVSIYFNAVSDSL
jgi:hypothetical protein